MRNLKLAEDYYRRASVRLKTLDLFFAEESWADVVRESQEAVELALKGLLRSAGIESPRVHDVSQTLLDNRDRLPQALMPKLERISVHSRQLRRDRELAFYGSEDLTPGEFYRREDAAGARQMAHEVIEAVGIAFPR
jgi:HEPN domain-containing protein